MHVTFAALKGIFRNQNNILRGGAVVARWAHNPKVVGSNPASATKPKESLKSGSFFMHLLLYCADILLK